MTWARTLMVLACLVQGCGLVLDLDPPGQALRRDGDSDRNRLPRPDASSSDGDGVPSGTGDASSPPPSGVDGGANAMDGSLSMDAAVSTDGAADGGPSGSGGGGSGGGGTGNDGGPHQDDGALSDAASVDASSGGGSGGDSDAGALLEVGASCTEDGQCETGYCYPVNLSNPYCYATKCTIGCASSDDCQEYAESRGGGATDGSCVPHVSGSDAVCDFSWGTLPGVNYQCE